jgi:hypothetical protein
MLRIEFMPSFAATRSTFFLAFALTLPGLAAYGADVPESRFGFTGPEIFPIDNQISLLHVADMDGDGLMDIVVANNARSRVNILYNQTGKTNQTEVRRQSGPIEINQLPPDARFRIESIASEKRISSLVVADLNGDKRPDLAYYGEPREMVIQYNLGAKGWSQPKRFPIDDGQLGPNALTRGDVNGDGRADVVLLAENHLYLFIQKPDGTLGEPEKLPFSGSIKSVQVLDIDGHGRDDLLLVNWENPNPFRFRLQGSNGQFGPEFHFTFPPVRAYWADDLDGDHKTDVMTIAANSGRAAISTFAQKPAETLLGDLKLGQFQLLPLNRTDKDRRGTCWADLNGDGQPDLLVAEPGSGQLTVYLQSPDGSFAGARTFSCMTGVNEITVADWDGDGKPEVFLLSADERQVGVTRLDANGRLPFPRIVPLEGRPLAMAVGALESDGRTALAVIVDQDGKRLLNLQTADGKSRTQKLGENFKSNPNSMIAHDINQDGLTDLVVLVPYEKMKLLLQTSGRDFQEMDVTPPGGNAEQPWVSLADVDGDGKPELLLAQKNFMRAVVLQSDNRKADADAKPVWGLTVKEQINGVASNSRIIAAAPLARGVDEVPLLFLLDAERKCLTLCERDKAGVWQILRNIPLPATEFTQLRGLNLGGARANAVGFLGLNAAAWLPLQGEAWEFAELDGYETPIKDGRLMDVVTGDLNGDGRKDLVFLETAKNHIDIVMYDAKRKLVPANRWQVFEERTFRNRRSEAPEPREAVVADVTGDAKNDLIVLVHDRILVYPQD